MIQVVEITAYRVKIPLKKEIRHASHRRTETENILVECKLSDKTVGFGEGVPREYVTGESAESSIGILKQANLKSHLSKCTSFPEAVEMIRQITMPAQKGDDRSCQGNAARCALELALLDAYGKSFGEPLSKVTQILTPELYEPKDKIQYSGAITSTQGWKLNISSWKMRLYGFRQLKVKVGIEGQNDVERLRKIRSRVGKKMDIRIDANEAWTPEEALERIHELLPFNITSVEQPVPHERIARWGEIRKSVEVPIMLDESLCSMKDAEQALAQNWGDLYNIRLSKCGGFIPSLLLARFAQQNKLGYQLGCQVGETALLSAAGRHFGCSVRAIRYREGSYDSHLVTEALGTSDLTFGWGGWAKRLPLDGLSGGLGIDIDPVALSRVSLGKEVFYQA